MANLIDRPPRSLRLLWTAIGWFGVALLIVLSLMPNPPRVDIDHFDKMGHTAAYALLMCWFAQLDLALARRLATASLLVGLGIALEYVQRATGYRTFEYLDMAADTVGVAVGWLLAPPRLPNLLTIAERLVPRRT